MRVFLLRWLIGFAYLLEGVLKIVSLGFIQTGMVLFVAKKYSKAKYTQEGR